ncbi:phosphatidate cytidylyltransferase [Blastopirellula sp. JC732]|uniref:Phosphatidate cytidylyltransferase n=1 Tax=Blastopirellula sediminis TaxID=2894196 RepID=A0A9X1SG97_9BACT|nr:phosphatidate cytidylyltransferase [Blastopirellula sediminis]MCC9608471.1 phosphatidate cytidylyltransferase [Blastopirellula sediminis]MCC9628752.1 phosphatidate cytidylyltransferase [Blastopirellula sediminis]
MSESLMEWLSGWTRFEHLTTEVIITLSGIALALVIASILVRVQQRLQPDRDHTELRLRVRTWWVIAWMFGLAVVLSPMLSAIFLAFVSFLALKEYFSLIPTRRADRRVLFWAYLAIPVQYYLAYIAWYGMFLVFIPVYMFLFLPARVISIGETKGYLRAVSTLNWGLMTMVFSLSHMVALLTLKIPETALVTPDWPDPDNQIAPGVALLVLLVLLTQFNDVAQYIWGKSFGRMRAAPTVSPGKTVAGLLGGIGSTVVLAVLLGPWLTILNWQTAALGGALIAVSGFVGDLSISALKRDLGVKDSGSMLPGHGGILDRVDSLTYTTPIFFHFLYYCYG